MEHTAEQLRVMNIELAIMGKWDNEKMSFFFVDTPPSGGGLGDLWIGPPDFKIFGQTQYQIFIKEDKPFLRIVNEFKGEEQIKEYEIVINNPLGELKLITNYGGEMVLHRSKN